MVVALQTGTGFPLMFCFRYHPKCKCLFYWITIWLNDSYTKQPVCYLCWIYAEEYTGWWSLLIDFFTEAHSLFAQHTEIVHNIPVGNSSLVFLITWDLQSIFSMNLISFVTRHIFKMNEKYFILRAGRRSEKVYLARNNRCVLHNIEIIKHR